MENKTLDQITIAKQIVKENPSYTLSEIQKIIQREQEITMSALSEGYKVVKKNYITLYPLKVKERTMVSPLNGEKYTIPSHQSVGVRVGEGFKALVGNRKMPSKICRSVTKHA